VPSVRASARRSRYKKETNQIPEKNVGKTDQFASVKKMSLFNFRNKALKGARKLLDHYDHEQPILA